LIAATIAPRGTCGQLLAAALDGRWRPVASLQLLAEVDDVLARPKFRRWLTLDEATRFVHNLRELSDVISDPPPPTTARCADPDDEYLLTLASVAPGIRALVSGDHHLTDLTDVNPPVVTPAEFLARLSAR